MPRCSDIIDVIGQILSATVLENIIDVIGYSGEVLKINDGNVTVSVTIADQQINEMVTIEEMQK